MVERRNLSAAQTDLPVLKPFTYNAGGQADNLLFSHWLAEFSPRSLALFAAIVLLWPSIALAQSNYSFGQAMDALWRWLPFIVGQGFVLNLLVSVVTMLVGTIAGVLLGLGQISPIRVISGSELVHHPAVSQFALAGFTVHRHAGSAV